jgi:hypothetical protein
MLDNVKGKIIEPTKTPDSNGEQNDNLNLRVLKDEKPGGKQAEKKEQESLKLNTARIGDVFHV